MEKAKVAKNLITYLDRDPSSPTLEYEGISSKKNFLGGIIGLAFLILTFYLVISKGINIIQKNDVILASYIRRDMSRVDIDNKHVQLVVFQYTEEQENPLIPIPFSDYSKHGIRAVVMQISANYSQVEKRDQFYFHKFSGNKQLTSTNITSVPMKPCKYYPDPKQDTVLCAQKLEYHPQCNLDSIDLGACAAVSQYYIMVMPCDLKEDPTCNIALTPNLIASLFVRDTKFNVLEKNSKKIFERSVMGVNSNINHVYPLNPKYRLVLQVQVTHLIIQSDQSLLPEVIFSDINKTDTYFYPQESIGVLTTTSGFMPAYITFDLVRSPFTQAYYRSYARFDTMLGQVFGLIGLMALVATCCCSGYNDWLMKKHVKENLKGQKTYEGDTIAHYWKNRVTSIYKKNKEEQVVIDMIKLCRTVERLSNIANLHLQENQRPVSCRQPSNKDPNEVQEDTKNDEADEKVIRSSGQIKDSLIGSEASRK